MNKLKTVIILLCICIVMIIMFLLLYEKENVSQEEESHVHQHVADLEADTDLVMDNVKFFTVSACVSQYLDLLNVNNDIYFGYDESGNYQKVLNPLENIIEVLNENYINKNNITVENLSNNIKLFEEKMIFIPLKMRVLSNDVIDKYVVYGLTANLNNEYMQDIYCFVNIDEGNSTFSIEPISENYDSINEIEIKNEEKSIEEKSLNIYNQFKIDSEYMVKKYFDFYKRITLGKPELLYQYLDEQYRNKRFGSLEKYKEYIEKNRKEIESFQCKKYLVDNYNDYIEYVCQDQYQNLYIFDEIKVMDFSLKLDTYTIMTEKFKDEYDKSNDQKRIMLNIDKWVQMLNNRDYSAAYAVLDETFRNNKFGSEEKFEQFMREKLPLHYKVEFGEYSNETDIGMQEITFTDITGENLNAIKTTIIMQLKDNYDFVMSFEV